MILSQREGAWDFGGSDLSAIFIHLSDIHFGQEKDGGQLWINNDAKERLLADAKEEIEKLGRKASGIIVTGDISYSSKVAEYVEAGKWLDRLAEQVGCDRLDIQIVPGNHDIDWNAITPMTKYRLDSIKAEGEATLNLMLDDEGEREALYERFAAYRDFSTGYDCELDVGGQYSADGVVVLAPGRSIRFVRMNSALACSKGDAEGELLLGARQRVFEPTNGEEIIALIHHPLNWLQDSDEARKYIRARARVLMSGHEHFPSLEIVEVEDGCDLMLLAAGATAPDEFDEQHTYKYNILEFDWDEDADALSVTINPRTWDDEHKRFEKDVAFLEGKAERNVLGSPFFRKAPVPSQSDVVEAEEADGRPRVVPAVNRVTGSAEVDFEMEDDVRLVRLRFFRDITEAQRKDILIALGAIPADLSDKLDHSIEQRFFMKLVRQGRLADLSAAVAGKTDATGGK